MRFLTGRGKISSGLIQITSELIRITFLVIPITFLVIRITSELIRMIFLVNRMSPELIPITSEVNQISSEVIRMSCEVIRTSWEVKSGSRAGKCRGGKQKGMTGAGYRNALVGAPVGSADDDQSAFPGLAAGLRVRLNSCFISFTNSSTPALGEATLAKEYTSSAC